MSSKLNIVCYLNTFGIPTHKICSGSKMSKVQDVLCLSHNMAIALHYDVHSYKNYMADKLCNFLLEDVI